MMEFQFQTDGRLIFDGKALAWKAYAERYAFQASSKENLGYARFVKVKKSVKKSAKPCISFYKIRIPFIP